MSPAPPRAIVVSLHDVSPRTRPACERILEELRALGVPRTSLLVIPDHHHQAPLRNDAACQAWLRELEREGHEIVTHGYFHRRERRSKEGTVQRLMTRVYTADEGEFYDLDRNTARTLVTRANADLTEAGLQPRGFIAPAWLLSDEAEEALRDLGVEYTTRLGTVSDLRERHLWPTQSLVWSVRAAWRRTVSLGWNALLFRRLAENPILRVSIHPVDIDHPSIWRQIRALITQALRKRTPMTYAGWLDQQRATSTAPSLS